MKDMEDTFTFEDSDNDDDGSLGFDFDEDTELDTSPVFGSRFYYWNILTTYCRLRNSWWP